MLVLSRRRNEQIAIPGLDITFTVLGIRGNRVQIGIQAPPDIEITRPGTTRPEKATANDQSIRRMMIRSSAVTSMTAISSRGRRPVGA